MGNIKINLIGKKRIDHGCSGVVYDLGNGTCFKKIYNEEFTNKSDHGSILRTIQGLNLHNFCRINEIVYDANGYVIGYIMPIYQTDKELDILSLPKDYILDSYNNIYNGIITLSNNQVMMKDLDSHNTFITKDGIIVYDYDMYTKMGNTKYVAIYNIAKLNIVFNEIFKNELLYKHSILDPRLVDHNTDLLFNSRTTPDTLVDTLSSYRRPIEYLKKHH